MTPIPPKVRKEIDADPAYKTCMLYGQHGHVCGGRITMEHALIFAGNQVQTKFAIISVCAKGQEVDNYQDAHTMVKELNQWIALSRATDQDLKEMCGEGLIRELSPLHRTTPYIAKRDRLIKKYGVYEQKIPAPIAPPPRAFPEITPQDLSRAAEILAHYCHRANQSHMRLVIPRTTAEEAFVVTIERMTLPQLRGIRADAIFIDEVSKPEKN